MTNAATKAANSNFPLSKLGRFDIGSGNPNIFAGVLSQVEIWTGLTSWPTSAINRSTLISAQMGYYEKWWNLETNTGTDFTVQ
jgi:hypothetical protein